MFRSFMFSALWGVLIGTSACGRVGFDPAERWTGTGLDVDAGTSGSFAEGGSSEDGGSNSGALTFETRVMSSNDDAEQDSSGVVLIDDGDLDLGDPWVAMRFRGLPRGPKSLVRSAYIEFASQEFKDKSSMFTVSAEATDDARSFMTTELLSSRTRGATTVAWAPVTWQAGAVYRTIDIAPVIQEIVSRSGFRSGNAIAIFVSGAGDHDAESFDGDSSKAPLLHVEYE